MKKILVFALTLAVALSLAACGAGGQGEENENVYSDLKTIVLTGGDSTSEGSAGQLFGQFFSERVSDITEGKLSVNYHPNGALGGDLDLLGMAKKNQIQIVVCQTAPMVSFVPEMAVFDLPMVFAEYDGDRIDSVINGRNAFTERLSAAYEEAGFHLLGFLQNGTYRLTTANRDLASLDEVIELEAYKDYWNGASPLDTVTLYVIADDSTRALALQSGQIDLGQRIGAADIETLKNDSDYAVYENSGTRVQLLVMNHTNQFLSDINVRKALAYCINYDALVAITGGLYAVAGAPFPPSSPYGWDQLDRQHYDADAAKACLAEAGFTLNGEYMEKGGKQLAFKLMYDEKSLATVMEAIQSMAKAVGIKITLQPVDTLPDLMSSDDSFEIVLSNWQSLSTGDPGWFLDNMYRSDGPNNRARYVNPKLDAICDELAGAFEFSDRQRLTIEAEKLILADCVNIMMFARNNFVMAGSNVKNVTVFPIDYYFLTNTRWASC